jgi:hypothetical protein
MTHGIAAAPSSLLATRRIIRPLELAPGRRGGFGDP